jgi:hypothetical protein
MPALQITITSIPVFPVICLAALAMRRRSRSVPRDAPESEQIVGLLMRTRPSRIRPLKHPTSGERKRRFGQTTLRGDSAELRRQQTFLIH